MTLVLACFVSGGWWRLTEVGGWGKSYTKALVEPQIKRETSPFAPLFRAVKRLFSHPSGAKCKLDWKTQRPQCASHLYLSSRNLHSILRFSEAVQRIVNKSHLGSAFLLFKTKPVAMPVLFPCLRELRPPSSL